jgi:xanthine dehydrogenase YagS FAD-binding subunit
MKLDVMAPAQVVDINELPLREIDTTDGLWMGPLARMSDVAEHPDV